MRIAAESFRGEAPRVTPRELPENAAQLAINARLQSGDLETWRQFVLAKELLNGATVRTIYLLNDEWLSWTEDVDVARGAIPGDNTFRVYLTGPEVYDQPRFTNYALATTGAEPFPVTTRPLGVPAPDSQPTLESGVSTAPSSTTLEVIDEGDELALSWSTSSPTSNAFTRSIVSQEAAIGNGAPSYSLQSNENATLPAWMLRDFGVGDSQVVFFSVDVMFNTSPLKRMFLDLMASSTGAGIGVIWTETGGFQIGIMAGASAQGFSSLAGVAALVPGPGVWYTVTATIIQNAAGTKTVTATLYQGSAQLATVTVTNAFTNSGGFMGFVAEVAEPTAPDPVVYYDNILVRGTSPTAALQQTATSYVYTFVNDLGEESAPSPPSATVLKDDGTAITVTSATAVQSGFSDDYSVTHKRIYRATSGATGTVFRFVAETPLAQAEYVDELTDAELGDPLETELYALPPDDLRGMLALPNGIMVGFRRNQICFSAQNRPHAWPVEWRLNTDTDVVCIGNIDTTLVIGTEAFPYLAIGNDPSAYSMTKLEVPQACVSKRSVAYLTGIGVIFASPDGLVAVSGNGKVSNLTEQIFTRRQWQALVPESILGIAHDDVYHFWPGTVTYEVLGTPLTFDPATAELVGDWTFSDGNRTASVVPGTSVPNVRSAASSARSSGKHYVEFKWLGTSLAFPDGVRLEVGLGDPAGTDEPSVDGVGYRFSGTVRRAGSAAAQFTGPAVATNDIIGFAFDIDTGNCWIAINNVWFSGDPAAGTSPTVVVTDLSQPFVPIVSSESPVQNSWTLYGTTELFNYNPPSGFSAWGVDGAITTVGGEDGGLMLDAKPTGFGLARSGFHVAAAHADPLTDQLYLVLDAVNEPLDTYLPQPSTAPEVMPPFVDIYAFDSPNAYTEMVYQYKGKLNLLPRPTAFVYCQIKAQDYSNLMLNLFVDEELFASMPVTSKEPFTIPLLDEYEAFEFELVGTSRVRTVQFVEDIRELT
jgi:hypothetical protein